MIRFSVIALLVAPVAAAASGEAVEASAREILEQSCLGCHGAAAMSGLDLRDRAGMLRGGKRGPAVVPHEPDASLLYQAVARSEELAMPPGDSALAADEVASLREWIAAGAPWGERVESDAARWWSFRKPERPPVPKTVRLDWVRTPVDAFVLAKLEEQSLAPAPEADRRTLIRRATFDLHGLPPTPEEVDAFVSDREPGAWERVIDRLLESPRYGERWGRHWLDLVRYADTSGFETDHFYTEAWRYRDYVIESFNDDKPYDVFVQEQIAADEIWGTDTELEGVDKLTEEKARNLQRRIGTSLFTLGAFPIEYTFYGKQYRAEWRAEAVDVVGSAFLGLTLECARCHDHKFDPVSQRDYYRLTALFAGSEEQEVPLGSLFDVQTATRSFPLTNQARILKRMAKRAKGDERDELLKQLGEAYLRAGDGHPVGKVLGHREVVPDVHVLAKGDFKQPGEKVEPGFPAAILPGEPIEEPQDVRFIPARRKALAEWLTSPDHPLTARVMVNRIWQGHFGAGLVRTPNDFGRQGEPPTHPELLDWLAVEFVDRGWSLKRMHKLLLTSSAYRMASVASGEALERDPENRLLSRMNRRRLDADAIRDSILAVSGALNLEMGGVGVIPELTDEEILAARMPHLWPAHPDPEAHNRRSVYLQMKRSLTVPMLAIFDAPDTASSCPRRETSTVAPQALALLNSPFTAEQSQAFAERLRKAADEPGPQVDAAWRIALGRPPTADERRIAVDYLNRNDLERLGLLIFNLSEFLYVD